MTSRNGTAPHSFAASAPGLALEHELQAIDRAIHDRLESGDQPEARWLTDQFSRIVSTATRLADAFRTDSEQTAPFLTDREIEQLPDVEFLVDGLIPLGSAAEIHGPPGAGKSFLALAIACAVATGRGFFGRPVRRGSVVYVVGEGVLGIKQRVRAWRTEHGVSSDLGIHYRNGPVQLLELSDVARFIADVKSLELAPELIVIDTLARCMVGGDENSAKDMGQAIAAIDLIRRETRSAILLVHHTRKDGELERGSTALRGALDAMVLVQNENGHITLSCEKQKDAPPFAPISLRMKSVDTSCVLVTTNGELVASDEGMRQQHHQAIKSLSADFLEDGAPSTKWLKSSRVKEQTFYRAVTDLVRWGYVNKPKEKRGGHYTLTDRGREFVATNYQITTSLLPTARHNSLPPERPPLEGARSGSDSQVEAWEAA